MYLSEEITGKTKIVTGFWKTDQNVILGQLHFLDPANSHTHTLPVQCGNTMFS